MSTDWAQPCEPWDVWKPVRIPSGLWQAMRDSDSPFSSSRQYDVEQVVTYAERYRRPVLHSSLEACELRCHALNNGYGQHLRDERSSFPCPSDAL